MVINSTNIKKANNYLFRKKTTKRMVFEIQILTWNGNKNVAGLNLLLNCIPVLPNKIWCIE